MKKVMILAMMFMASTMTFAGDSDALKAILKTKTYDEANQLLKANIASLTDNAEKAKAYNHVLEIVMKKVDAETKIMTENQLAIQMQQADKQKAYDTLGLADAICQSIELASECNKYDQLPNAKGKVAPKFAEKNASRIWGVRSHLVNTGQEEARKEHKDATLKYWGAFTDSAEDPLFAAQNHDAEKEYAGQVAFFAGRYAFDLKDMDRANRYFEIAKKDPQQKADALNFQLWAMRSNLKNHADSVECINKIKAIYDAEPENDAVLDALNSMYDGMKDKAAQNALLDNHLAKFPNSFAALANKGLMAMSDNNAEVGAEWLRKAAAAKPDNAVVFTYLGICLNAQAGNTDDDAKRKALFKEAIEAFDKAKELDPDKRQANWGYNRYQAYYGLYGEDDSRTKAAEADR